MSDSTLLGRLHYVRALKYAPTSLLGLLRMLWSDYVLHVLLDRGTETCEDCGSWRFQLWTSPDDLWLEASPSGGPCGILCLHCFSTRLRKRGVIVEFNASVLRRISAEPKP